MLETSSKNNSQQPRCLCRFFRARIFSQKPGKPDGSDGIYLNISFVGVASAQGVAPAKFPMLIIGSLRPFHYRWRVTESFANEPWLSGVGLICFLIFALLGWRDLCHSYQFWIGCNRIVRKPKIFYKSAFRWIWDRFSRHKLFRSLGLNGNNFKLKKFCQHCRKDYWFKFGATLLSI